MTKIFISLISIILFTSCKEELAPIEVIKEVEVQPELVSEDTFNYDTLTGLYIGDFSDSKIRIIINYASKTKAIGYNIHKGLLRNLSGSVLKSNDTIYMTLAEPGDHKYDGVFNLTFVGADENPSAIWASNSGEVKPKVFSLAKKNKKGNNDELNEFNFHNYFDASFDTIGNYTFNDDGFMVFTFYPTNDKEERVEQYNAIKGTWSYEKPIVTFEWEDNNLFPSIEKFEVIEEEYGYEMKQENGRTITTMYW